VILLLSVYCRYRRHHDNVNDGIPPVIAIVTDHYLREYRPYVLLSTIGSDHWNNITLAWILHRLERSISSSK